MRNPISIPGDATAKRRAIPDDSPDATGSAAAVQDTAASGLVDASAQFRRDLLAGLGRKPRSVPPKYFYDVAGSRLFDQICELPEYYPTRTELAILARHAREMAACIGAQAEIIEFGAGSLTKVRLLLDALDSTARYLPIDISREHLEGAARILRAERPQLAVQPIAADYTRAFSLPQPLAGAGRRAGFFPGSTLGNFSPDEAQVFLHTAAGLLRGGGLLLGIDLVKEPALLHAAYNDAQGVTAAFNLNLLHRANAELGADFDLTGFSHAAFYNAPFQRIEMHLVSRRAQAVHVAGQRFAFEEGETIHTENSYKYTPAGLHALAQRAGFGIGPAWVDKAGLFAVHWLVAPDAQ